jgi:SAM-dependent methyltransferase
VYRNRHPRHPIHLAASYGNLVLELSWIGSDAGEAACPSCDITGPHRVLVSVQGGSNGGMRLLSCSACTATHFDPMPHPDYGDQPAGGAEALSFYLQQGAGIWSIAANVLPLDLPGPRRMLEIGCGFGFGLDVARRVRGWEVQGFDPSPLAAAGAAQLDLPIANRYFTAEQGEIAAYDAVVCSEVIEHLFRPVDILRLLRSALRPGGVLVVTTPNAGAITPAMTPGILVPLLSVGFHTIIHTAESLARALRAAGFSEVSVEDRGPSLLAHASDTGTPWRQPDAADRAAYRAYLEATAAAVPSGGDLRLGLLVRAYRDGVAAGDLEAADRLGELLRTEVAARFGQPPEAVPVGGPVSLEVLAREQPLALGPLLYAQAMHKRLRGVAAAEVHDLLGRAAAACDRLRASLGRIGTDDGDAEDIAWVARSEQILAAAEAGLAVPPERLDSLGPAPGDAAISRTRTAMLRRRCFTSLVNVGRLADARAFQDVVHAAAQRAEAGATLADDEIDCLLTGAVLALNDPPGDPATARRLTSLLQQALRNLPPGSRSAGLAGPAAALERTVLERFGEDETVRAWIERAGSVIASAEAGVAAAPGRLDALGPAPGARSLERMGMLRRKLLVTLVNRGSLEEAREFRDAATAAAGRTGAGADLQDDEIDCLYTGAVLALNDPPGDAEAALELVRLTRQAVLSRLRVEAGARSAGLAWPAAALEHHLLERLGRDAEREAFEREVLPALRAHPALPPEPAGFAAGAGR